MRLSFEKWLTPATAVPLIPCDPRGTLAGATLRWCCGGGDGGGWPCPAPADDGTVVTMDGWMVGWLVGSMYGSGKTIDRQLPPRRGSTIHQSSSGGGQRREDGRQVRLELTLARAVRRCTTRRPCVFQSTGWGLWGLLVKRQICPRTGQTLTVDTPATPHTNAPSQTRQTHTERHTQHTQHTKHPRHLFNPRARSPRGIRTSG